MRTLAIDPGSKQLGYAIFNGENPMLYGQRSISGTRGFSRIRDAILFLTKIIAVYKIEHVVIERPPNVYRNAVVLALLFDDVIATFKVLGIRYKVYTPGQWRKLIGITQRKSEIVKQKALEYVDEELGIVLDGKDHDTAEALCMGYAYIVYGHKRSKK